MRTFFSKIGLCGSDYNGIPHRTTEADFDSPQNEKRFLFAVAILVRGSVSPRCALGSAVLPEFFLAKRLELKSLKGQTKAAELGPRGSQFLSLRLPLKAL
jgi:hypothetical protein